MTTIDLQRQIGPNMSGREGRRQSLAHHGKIKWKPCVLLLAVPLLVLSGWYASHLYQQNRNQQRLVNQGLIIPGNDETYAQGIRKGYQLLVEKYVIPVSPLSLYQSAVDAMELVVQSWQKEQQEINEEGRETLSQWEKEARFAFDAKKAASIRAPKARDSSQLTDRQREEREQQKQQFEREYREYPPKALQEAYQEILSESRLQGYYSKVFAKTVYTSAMGALSLPLHDPFSGFFQESGFYQLSDTINGSYGGVGLYISKQSDFGNSATGQDDNDAGETPSSNLPGEVPPAEQYRYLQQHYVKVTRPVPGGPSMRAGILSDDFIYAIDGRSAKDWAVEQVQGAVRGVPGSKVRITLLRRPAQQLDIEVVRERLEIQAVLTDIIPAQSLKGKSVRILYVYLSQFNAVAGKQLTQQLEQALAGQESAQQVDALILDLRDNLGGLLNVAVEIADQFLSQGLIVSTDARTRDNILKFEAKKQALVPADLPVYVMINDESASAAEIVAGALQDNRRAEILGQKSFGKGSVQIPVTLPEGILKLTIAHYYTPKGVNLANNGIEPDHQLSVPPLAVETLEELGRLAQSSLIANFVNENRSYTEQEFRDFFAREIESQYQVSKDIAERMAYRERIRYLKELPVYNLDHDQILRQAVAYAVAYMAEH